VSAVRHETVPCTPTWTIELQDAKIERCWQTGTRDQLTRLVKRRGCVLKIALNWSSSSSRALLDAGKTQQNTVMKQA